MRKRIACLFGIAAVFAALFAGLHFTGSIEGKEYAEILWLFATSLGVTGTMLLSDRKCGWNCR